MTAAKLRSEEQLKQLTVLTDDDMASGQQAFQTLKQSNPGLDAVVCISDTIAAGVYMETHGAITITGFDDTPVSRSLNFSSIKQPLSDIAKAILDSLQQQRTHSEDARMHLLFPPQLVIR